LVSSMMSSTQKEICKVESTKSQSSKAPTGRDTCGRDTDIGLQGHRSAILHCLSLQCDGFAICDGRGDLDPEPEQDSQLNEGVQESLPDFKVLQPRPGVYLPCLGCVGVHEIFRDTTCFCS